MMSRLNGGYTLDQLLKWCEEDRLIDGYDKDDDTVVIFLDGGRRTLSHSDATILLKGIFTATQRGSNSKTDDVQA